MYLQERAEHDLVDGQRIEVHRDVLRSPEKPWCISMISYRPIPATSLHALERKLCLTCHILAPGNKLL